MTYYLTYVLLMAGLTGNINLISGGVQYALFIIFTLVTYLFIDKTGRRPLLIYGAIGMGICHLIVGGVLGMYSVPVPGGVEGNANVVIQVTGAPSHVVIAFSYLLIIVYALTLAPVAWVYASEVWSLETRGQGMALAALGNWLFNFAIGLFIPPAFKNISWKTFIVSFGDFGNIALGGCLHSIPRSLGSSVLVQRFKPSFLIQRQPVSLSKRSNTCSVPMDPIPGKPKSVTHIWTRSFTTLWRSSGKAAFLMLRMLVCLVTIRSQLARTPKRRSEKMV
jgi:hypothetical protein